MKSEEEMTIPIPRRDGGVDELLGRLEADREAVQRTDIDALDREVFDAYLDLF